MLLFLSGRSAVWLAHLVWDQGVEGSNPFAPTTFMEILILLMVGVAQLVRASVCGTEGRGFEPHHPPHYIIYKQTLVI